MPLRPYQEALIQRLGAALRGLPARPLEGFRAGEAPHPRGVVGTAATGAGKTHLAAEVVRRFLQRDPARRAAFVADLIEISADTTARFRDAGLDVGVVAAGVAPSPEARVQVCQLQTLCRRLGSGNEPPPADLVIWDEAHGIEGDEAQRLVRAWAPGILLGITATPCRGDGRGLGRTFSALVEGPQTAELQAAGHLVPLDVIAPSSGYLDKGIAMTPEDAYRRFCAGPRPSRALVFCADGQARRTAAAFVAAGIPAEVLASDTKRKVRATQRERVREGTTLVLCTVDCAVKGYDLPALDTVILARGVSTPGTYLQMVGRALRPDPSTGKERARLIDLRGVCWLHGLPDELRSWSLGGEAVRLSQPSTSYSRCGACLWLGGARPSGSPCPACGAALGRPVAPPRVVRAAMLERMASLPLAVRRARYEESLRRTLAGRAARVPAHRRGAWIEDKLSEAMAAWDAARAREARHGGLPAGAGDLL